MGLIAITNPSDESAQAGIVNQEASASELTPAGILERYGSKLEDGAQVTMVNNGRVWQYVATREDDNGSVALRSNNGLAAHPEDDRELSFIEFVAGGYEHGEHIIEVADAELEAPANLETFTVYGTNDDNEPFTAVIAATEATAHEEGVKAGLVDEGYEHCVTIIAILRGDRSEESVESV